MSDILIKNGFIVTMNKDNKIIPNGSIYVNGDKIISIDKDEIISKEYPTAEYIINAKHKVVLPGFVNTHAHLPAHHLRGVYGRGIGELYNITFPLTKYIDINDSYLYSVASCA